MTWEEVLDLSPLRLRFVACASKNPSIGNAELRESQR